METYLNLNGVECVVITNHDGTVWSGFKSAYEQEQAANEATNEL
jgi:hypothetical protein